MAGVVISFSRDSREGFSRATGASETQLIEISSSFAFGYPTVVRCARGGCPNSLSDAVAERGRRPPAPAPPPPALRLRFPDRRRPRGAGAV